MGGGERGVRVGGGMKGGERGMRGGERGMRGGAVNVWQCTQTTSEKEIFVRD